MENEFVRVVVSKGPNETGRFSIRTTGGDPTIPLSKNKHLIFGGDKPWTSYSTINIDGVPYIFGGPTNRHPVADPHYGKTITVPTVVDNNKISYTESFGDIEVTQELGFVRGKDSRMYDTIGVSYTVINKGTGNHSVGIRVLLDTMCGDNDGAPFRAGNMAISTATMLSGKEIPDYWQAFDSLANPAPSVICQGTLRGQAGTLTPPDKLLFADWGTLADDAWEPTLTPGQGFIRKGETDPDTAMAMFWNPAAIEPGKSKTYLTHFGIGYVTIKAGKLALGLTGVPKDATYEFERTQSFTVTGYLQNTGVYLAHDVVALLDIPKGLILVGGDNAQRTQTELKPGESMQMTWTLKPDGQAGGDIPLKFSVTSGNIEPNDITQTIQVAIPTPRLNFMPASPRVRATPEEPEPVIMKLNLAPASQFRGCRISVQFDPNVVMLSDISRGTAFFEGGDLYWHVDKTQIDKGMLTFSGCRIDADGNPVPFVKQATTNIATLRFYTINAGKSAITITKAVLLDEKADILLTSNGKEVPLEFTNGDIEVVNK